MESRRNGPQLSSRHDDDDVTGGEKCGTEQLWKAKHLLVTADRHWQVIYERIFTEDQQSGVFPIQPSLMGIMRAAPHGRQVTNNSA